MITELQNDYEDYSGTRKIRLKRLCEINIPYYV